MKVLWKRLRRGSASRRARKTHSQEALGRGQGKGDEGEDRGGKNQLKMVIRIDED